MSAPHQPTSVQRGITASIGACVATLAAHPFDILKIQQQVKGGSLLEATRSVCRSSPSALYAGVGAGVQQRVMSAGPMFFFTELFAQGLARNANLERGPAVWLGAGASGYLGGVVCAGFEWCKVLQARAVPVTTSKTFPGLPSALGKSVGAAATASTVTTTATTTEAWNFSRILHFSCTQAGAAQISRRFHGAGVRNALFDSTFFGTAFYLQDRCDLSPSFSFGAAAACAVIGGYSIDVGVKKNFALPPNVQAPSLRHRMVELFKGQAFGPALRKAHAGLPIKVVEFSVFFAVIGLVSAFIQEHVHEALVRGKVALSESTGTMEVRK